MRSLLTVFGVLLGAGLVFAGAVVEGNGQTESRKVDVRDFSAIEVGSGISLDVVQGDLFSVEIRADSNVIDRIRVERRGNALRIRMDPGVFFRAREMRAVVVMPRLERLDASGGSQAVMAFDMPRDRFSGSVSGGAGIRGTLGAGAARLEASGGGTVSVEGYCGSLSLEGSGGSRFLLFQLRTKEAAVELSGGSRAEVDVTDAVEVSMSGGSRLTYQGEPRIDARDSSGGSEIRRAQ